GTVRWVTADWAGDDSAVLLGAGDRPVLVVAAGEVPDLLDPAQLDRATAGAGAGFAAEVAAPAGPEVRLVSPGEGADARIGGHSAIRVHALRLRSVHDDDWLVVEPTAPAEPVRFVIAAPGYRGDSGGVAAMHRLCDVLNRLGHHAVLLPIDGRADTHPGWRTPLAGPAAVDGAVVVYPEIVVGNPLGAGRVVRWLLNRPGEVAGQGLGAGPDDLVVAWNRAIDPDLPLLTVPLFDPRLFFPKDAPGRGGLVWLGKGRLPHGFARAGTSLVTRAWPATRAELGAALRAADVLYSCDWMTALAFEALLCGTPVVLVGEQRWGRDELVANGIMLPGMAFEDGDLDAARAAVPGTAALYREQVDGAAAHVAAFAELVQRHFARGTRPQPAMAAAAAHA